MTSDLCTLCASTSLVRSTLNWALRCTILVAVAPAGAAPTSGTFADDDQLFVDAFTLPVAAQLSVATRSWAQGGFAPVLALFDDTSGLLLQLDAGSGHTCGQPGAGAADAATGFCWDAFLDTVLPAGRYALVLSQDGNAPTGDRAPGASFQSLYPQTGNPDYTGLAYLGQAGARFVNVDGRQREGAWSFELRIQPLQVPEPAVGTLLALALAALALMRRPSAPR